MSYSPIITVAAFNSPLRANESFDFVCTGKNDELVLNKAIQLAAEEEKSIYLLSGNYYLDDFYDFGDGGPKTAIYVPRISPRMFL